MNDSLTEIQATVAALKAEVETLKAKMAQMETVVDVYTEDDGRVVRAIDCNSFVLRDEADPRWLAVQMGARPDVGTFFQITHRSDDNRHKAAIRLAVPDEGEPEIQMLGTDCHVRASMWLDKDHGTVAVYRPGEVPAAVMRAVPGGASVAVVQADGAPRAVMVHREKSAGEGAPETGKTEIALLGADTKRALSLMEDPGGSTIKISNGDGEATLVARDGTSSLMLESVNDAASVLLVATSEMARVAAQEGGLVAQKSAAALHAGAFGAALSVHEPTGTERVSVAACKGQGSVSLLDDQGDARALLQANEKMASQLKLLGQGREAGVTLMADVEMSSLQLAAPHQPKTGLLATVKEMPTVLLTQAGEVRVASTIAESSGVVCAYGPGGQQAGMASLAGGLLSGSLAVATADGTKLVEIGGTDHGGRMALNNDLGLGRIVMGVHDESAGIHLNHTGTHAVHIAASPMGGVVTLKDADGKVGRTLTGNQRDDNDQN